MTQTLVIPDGLEQIESPEIGPRSSTMIAAWSYGSELTLLRLANCKLRHENLFLKWLKNNVHSNTKLLAFWEVEQQRVSTNTFFGHNYTSPDRLVGNVTIVKLTEGLVMLHTPQPNEHVLRLPGLPEPVTDQFLQLDDRTMLEVPERYTVMIASWAQL
jgi:hypothetical protein